MAQMDLLWLGVGAVAIWYIWGNGMGGMFNTSMASGELTGNPKPVPTSIVSAGAYSGRHTPTISGTWHL